MLYILLHNDQPATMTVDHEEAQQLFADASHEAPESDTIRLLQVQADCVHEKIPAPPKQADNRPLNDQEQRQLLELLARQHAGAAKAPE